MGDWILEVAKTRGLARWEGDLQERLNLSVFDELALGGGKVKW